MSKPPTILSAATVVKTGKFHIEAVDLQFSNGEQRQYERAVSTGGGAVVIVPLLDANTMLLVREYGVGLEQYYISFPRGGVDHEEKPIATAQRELMEEVGYGAGQLEPICRFAPSPSYLNAMTYGFLAKDLYPHKLEGDEPEPLEVIPWKLTEVDALLAHPEFIESRSIATLCYLIRKGVVD